MMISGDCSSNISFLMLLILFPISSRRFPILSTSRFKSSVKIWSGKLKVNLLFRIILLNIEKVTIFRYLRVIRILFLK